MALTIAQAEEKAALWQAALDECADKGEEYQYSKVMRRSVSAAECRHMVNYYEGMVARLTTGRRAGARQLRAVPRDY